MNKNLELAQVFTESLATIRVEDCFFDSLKVDYPEFGEWFAKVSREGRKAWRVDSGLDGIAGLCIFKVESEGESINDDGETLPGKFLKLCTLKVQDIGIRYGERLLYTAMSYAIENDLSALYVQVRQGKHPELCALLVRFGFKKYGKYRCDDCFVKHMRPDIGAAMQSKTPLLRFQFAVDYYPYHLDDASVRKFMVSMTESAHDALFPDARIQTLAFPIENRPIVGDSHAIAKTFVHSGSMASFRPADLLFFYVKGSYGQVDSMGIVEDYYLCPKGGRIPPKFVNKVTNGSIPPGDTILKNDMMIISFRLIQYLQHPILRMTFSAAGFDINHRSIRTVPERIYTDVIRPRLRNFGISCKVPKV